MQTPLDRPAAHEARSFELPRPPPVRRDRDVALEKVAPRASRGEVGLIDRSVVVSAEGIEVGDAVVADLALEPARRPARVRSERRNRRDQPPSAHTAELGERVRHPLWRNVLERLEHRDHVERVAREREPLRQVRAPDVGRDRAPPRPRSPIGSRRCLRPRSSSSRRASTTKPCAHPASSTRPGGKKRQSRSRGDIRVRRVACVALVARQPAT